MKIALTVDMERDPGTLSAFTNITGNMPYFLGYCRTQEIPCTIFVTGEVADRFKSLLSQFLPYLVIGEHCHPLTHIKTTPPTEDFKKLDKLENYSREEQFEMILKDKLLIEQNLSVKVDAFRAGRLSKNDSTIEILRKLDFSVDSSTLVPYVFRPYAIARKPWNPYLDGDMLEVPLLTFDSHLLDWTFRLKRFFIKTLDEQARICVGVHSWMLTEAVRHRFEIIIRSLREGGNEFVTLSDLL